MDIISKKLRGFDEGYCCNCDGTECECDWSDVPIRQFLKESMEEAFRDGIINGATVHLVDNPSKSCVNNLYSQEYLDNVIKEQKEELKKKIDGMIIKNHQEECSCLLNGPGEIYDCDCEYSSARNQALEDIKSLIE